MRFLRYFIVLALLIVAGSAEAKQAERIYIFGLAASFNDSTVYLTEIFEADSAMLEPGRAHFLANRSGYSHQLRTYFMNRGDKDRTCVTYWSRSRKDIEKQYAKVKKIYTGKNSKYYVKYLASSDFSYTKITADQLTTYIDANQAEQETTREARKAARKARKEAKAAKKQQQTPQPPQGGPVDGK